jgi:hypothetical protein
MSYHTQAVPFVRPSSYPAQRSVRVDVVLIAATSAISHGLIEHIQITSDFRIYEI